MTTVNFRPQIVKFGVWLTGHSEEDISQMLDDFSNGKDKSFPVDEPVSQKTADDENYKRVFEKYGKTHTIEKREGTKVDMTGLKENESVCWGDGISYHFLLTEK